MTTDELSRRFKYRAGAPVLIGLALATWGWW